MATTGQGLQKFDGIALASSTKMKKGKLYRPLNFGQANTAVSTVMVDWAFNAVVASSAPIPYLIMAPLRSARR